MIDGDRVAAAFAAGEVSYSKVRAMVRAATPENEDYLLVISRYVKSVACVNKRLHYHDQAEITGDMLEEMYSCSVEEVCPVELVAHGLPHRVLKHHETDHHD